MLCRGKWDDLPMGASPSLMAELSSPVRRLPVQIPLANLSERIDFW